MRGLPLVQWDYTFAKSAADGDARPTPILVGYWIGRGYGYAGVTLGKGVLADKAIVRDVVAWLTEVGLSGRIRLRSDGEPAITAVMRAIATTRGLDDNGEPYTVVEESPNKSSASLGGAERFAGTIGGLIRTIREDVRVHQNVIIKADSVAFSFLVSHCAYLHNRFQTRANGLTAFEDVHQKVFRESLFHFGQAVLVRKPTALLQPKAEVRWIPGV